MGMLAKIRRMHLREHLSIREIARRTGLSRSTVRDWLRQPQAVEPIYAKREVATKLDAYIETLSTWLTTNPHRGKRERRSVRSMYQELTAMGYRGGYGRVAAFARGFIAEESMRGSGRAFAPLKFQPGEVFQFDWSTEYAFVGGLRRRLDVAHTKLCASRAFWLTAYPTQSHEMLFGVRRIEAGSANCVLRRSRASGGGDSAMLADPGAVEVRVGSDHGAGADPNVIGPGHFALENMVHVDGNIVVARQFAWRAGMRAR